MPVHPGDAKVETPIAKHKNAPKRTQKKRAKMESMVGTCRREEKGGRRKEEGERRREEESIVCVYRSRPSPRRRGRGRRRRLIIGDACVWVQRAGGVAGVTVSRHADPGSVAGRVV